jgi:hypothetical protein
VPTPFGPQLIGETEKTLNAILRALLDGTGLSEPAWVTLRLAGQSDAVDRAALVDTVADRAHFADAAHLVDHLTERGLLEGGRLTAGGRDLVESVQASIVQTTEPIWTDLPAGDVAAAERLLDEVVRRARDVLARASDS